MSEILGDLCRRWSRFFFGSRPTQAADEGRGRAGAPRCAARPRRRPCLERLERRAVLAIDFVGSTATQLVVNLPDLDDAQDDDTELRVTAGNLVAHSRNGEHEDASASLNGINAITVNGRAGDDLLTLDASLATFSGTLIVNGGAGADRVRLGAGVRLTGSGAAHSVGVDLAETGARLNLDAHSTFDSVTGVTGTAIETDGFELTTGDSTGDAAGAMFAGTIGGTGRVRKIGAGAWTLEGSNTYVGTTVVSGTGSELRVNGAIGASGAAGAVSVASGAKLSGRGMVLANIAATSGATIEATGDGLTLGNPASSAGFDLAGTLRVGGFAVTLRDANAALLGASTTLAGGVLTAVGGVSLSSGDVISGYGTVAAPIDGNTGRILANTVGRTLTAGSATATAGIVGGDVQVDAGATLVLLDANGAVVNQALVNGRLVVSSGVTIAAGKTLTGTGTVQGVVAIVGGIAPGAGGPGVLSIQGALTLGGAATFEIGGKLPGATADGAPNDGYDQLSVTGSVNLTGATLSLARLGAFQPTGASLQSFVLIDNDGSTDPVIGTFAGLPEGAILSLAGTPLFVSYVGGDGNDVVLSTQPIVSGTAGADDFQVSYVVGDGGADRVLVTRGDGPGAPAWTFASPLPAAIHVRAGAGDDRVTVNDASGAARWELRVDGAAPGVADSGQDSLVVTSASPVTSDTGVTLATAAGVSIEYHDFEAVTSTRVASRVIDDGERGFALSPGPAAWRAQAAGYGGDALELLAGSTGGAARWRFTALPVGSYRLLTTFPAGTARPSSAPLRVYDGERLLTTIRLDERDSPADDRQFGAAWKSLATLPITSHALTLELAGAESLGGALVVDAMRLDWAPAIGAPLAPPALAPAPVVDVRTIDDGAPNFATSGAWSVDLLGSQGDSRRRPPGDGANMATWTFTGLAAGYYQVSATWPEKIWENTAAATFTVVGSDGPIDSTIDQRFAPQDLIDTGAAWGQLGAPVRVASDGGTLVVMLRDRQAVNFAVADAIRAERLLGPEISLVDVMTGDAPPTSGDLRVDLGTTTLGGAALERTFEIRNYGATRLAIGELRLPNGYELAASPAREVAAASGAGYGATTFRVRLPTTEAGGFRGELTLASGDEDESTTTVRLDGDVVRTAPIARIVDDGDASYADDGWIDSSARGYQGDQRQLPWNAGPVSARWTFTGLVPHSPYRVSARWSPIGGATTVAPFSVSSGGTSAGDLLGAVLIDQSVWPADFFADGTTWQDLGGAYRVGADGTLVVRLDASASGVMLADAVRVEPLSSAELQVVDDATGRTIPDGAGPLAARDVWSGESVTRSWTIRNPGSAPLTIGSPLLPFGYDLILAPAAIVPSGGTTKFALRLRDDLAPGDYDGEVVLPTNDGDEGRFKFRVATRVLARTFLLDDGDAGFAAGGAFALSTGSGYANDVRLARAGGAGGPASWTFAGLAAGVYQVAVTWPFGASPPPSGLAPDVTYQVSYGGATKTLRVDQRQPPDDSRAAGVAWEEFVGRVAHPGGDLVVTLPTTAPGGYLQADAVRVAWLDRPEIQVTVGGVNTTSGATTLAFPATFIGEAPPAKTLVIENVGAGSLTLPAAIAAPVGFRVTSDSGQTTLFGGETRTLVLRLDTDPTAEGARGGAKGGVLSIATNDADEAVYSLNVSGQVETVLIVDQAQPRFFVAGRAASFAATAGFRSVSGGYLGQSQYAMVAATNTATFTVANLPAGTYQVSTTYLARSSWATDAPFTVNGGPVIRVNEQSAPQSLIAETLGGQTASWQHLGAPITVTAGGTISVVVGGVAANKYVTADAIRVQWVSPPPVSVVSFASAARGTSETARAAAVANRGSASNAESLAVRDAWFQQLGLAELRRAWASAQRRRRASVT